MTRYSYAGGAADFVFDVAPSGYLRLRPASLLVWADEAGGVRVTDLKIDGVAVTSIPVDDSGQVPVFEGPDGFEGDLWVATAPDRPRIRLTSNAGIQRATAEADRAEAEADRAAQISGLDDVESALEIVDANPASPFRVAQDARVSAMIAAEVPAEVVLALSADSTPAAAAAAAVSTDLAARSVRTEVIYSRPTALTAATTQTGAPTYTGGKLSGGVLKLADVSTATSEVQTPPSPEDPDGSLGTFCVELLATITAIPAADRVAAQRDTAWSIRCRSTGNLGVYVGTALTTQIAANTVFTLNAQNHIALQFNAGVCSVFFNGVWRGDSAAALPASTETDLYIGGWSGNVGNNWPGTVDALRITKGVLYPAHDGFAPPTSLPAPRLDAAGRAFAPSSVLLHAALDDANVRLSTGAVGYPAHPSGLAEFIGPVEPAGMLVGDTWLEVTL